MTLTVMIRDVCQKDVRISPSGYVHAVYFSHSLPGNQTGMQY
jgi:hypothetical protein